MAKTKAPLLIYISNIDESQFSLSLIYNDVFKHKNVKMICVDYNDSFDAQVDKISTHINCSEIKCEIDQSREVIVIGKKCAANLAIYIANKFNYNAMVLQPIINEAQVDKLVGYISRPKGQTIVYTAEMAEKYKQIVRDINKIICQSSNPILMYTDQHYKLDVENNKVVIVDVVDADNIEWSKLPHFDDLLV